MVAKDTCKTDGEWNDGTGDYLHRISRHAEMAVRLAGSAACGHWPDGKAAASTLRRHGFATTRENIKAAFQAHPEESSVRILLATDAASEGVNLQNYCLTLVHYEIPWNPNRLEQRNGRIDRHGQRADQVDVFHFVGEGFREQNARDKAPGDLEGDLEFLLARRAQSRADPRRFGQSRAGYRRSGRRSDDWQTPKTRYARAENEANPARRMLRFERDLKSN